MAMDEVYVDPAAGNDTTGDGTSGTPWATVGHALDTYEESGSDGTRINVKAGTADTLTASLNDATFLTNNAARSSTKPLVIQGYTTTAGDGGIGEIDGDGTYSIMSDNSAIYLNWINMKLGNTGSNPILYLSGSCTATDCEFHSTTSSSYAVRNTNCIRCYFHDIDRVGAYNGVQIGCFFDGTVGADFSYAIQEYTYSYFNIILLGTTGRGIYRGYTAMGNSVLSSGCTSASAVGIHLLAFGGSRFCVSNIVEGFSGTGNIGIAIDTNYANIVANNAVYNCTTNYSLNGRELYTYDNEALDASPFTKGTFSYATRYNYFMPKAGGNVIGGAFPIGCRFDKGAVQHADPASGGVFRHPGLTGGFPG